MRDRLRGATAVLHDRQPILLEALERLLAGHGVEVVGRTAHPERLVELLSARRPDLALVDLSCDEPDPSWLEAVVGAHPGLRAVGLAPERDEGTITAAFAAGISVVVLKESEPEAIVAGARAALQDTRRGPRPDGRVIGSGRAERAGHDLTERELEVLRLVADGLSNSAMARRLWVTEQTVKFHLSNVYRKLGVANRTEASRWAHRHRLLDPWGES